ncbi:Na+/melibiose symporter-like transporter [Sediminihabitans luteus]|uniref:Na+/melibiose symporter-like transporter n=1 Tax=Sediminihabitans luteus TaxID=1138585 RepID=A0A2M9D0U2_9CELL|nr:MFS transporter [Sediminihabitans luteus]PJJ77816.1 Na+/melibiose symporter-like transporter [Sediminihabitans luteus]GII99826.1 MFS transporter [Sediminihabitans luteus]
MGAPPVAAPVRTIPGRSLLAYASGSLGMGIWVTVPGLLLLVYLTDVLGVTPWLAGLVVLVPKILDVVLHPWVGQVSDAQLARYGHRRRLLWVGTALALGMVLLFWGPATLTGDAAAIWVTGAFVLANLAFAAFQVPYLSTPSDLAIGYGERTRLMTYRMVVLTVGILVSGLLAPMISHGADGTRASYLLMALVLAVVMLLAMLGGIRGVRLVTRDAPGVPEELVAGGPGASAVAATPHDARPLRARMAEALRDRHFRPLVLAYLGMSTTSHLVLAGVPYFAKYELDRAGLATVLVAAFVAPALFATPLWMLASRRFGKQRCLLWAQGTFVVGSLVLALGAGAGVPVLVAAVAVLGTCFAAMQLFPFSMVPDVVRHHGDEGAAKAGTYTGVWTATEATGAALGPYLYASCLAIGGFVATTAGEAVIQPGAALVWVRIGMGVVPAVVMVAVWLVQRTYRLDEVARAAE